MALGLTRLDARGGGQLAQLASVGLNWLLAAGSVIRPRALELVDIQPPVVVAIGAVEVESAWKAIGLASRNVTAMLRVEFLEGRQ